MHWLQAFLYYYRLKYGIDLFATTTTTESQASTTALTTTFWPDITVRTTDMNAAAVTSASAYQMSTEQELQKQETTSFSMSTSIISTHSSTNASVSRTTTRETTATATTPFTTTETTPTTTAATTTPQPTTTTPRPTTTTPRPTTTTPRPTTTTPRPTTKAQPRTTKKAVKAPGSSGKQTSEESEGGGQYCSSRDIDRFYCEHGCCGDYREQHCCSFAGLVVGIIIGVALLIAVIAGIVYCWLKKKWRDNNQQVNFTRSNHNCNGANVTVLHQSSTMAITTTGNSAAPTPMFPAYAAPYGPPFPPPYSSVIPPPSSPPQKDSPPPYCQQPPPYSVRPSQRTTVHGIGSAENNRRPRDQQNQRNAPPPVS